MKNAIITGVMAATILIAGCDKKSSSSSATPPTAQAAASSSSRVAATPESVAKRVEQLSLQQERIEQLAIRSPHSSPDFLISIRAGRAAWSEHLRAEKQQRANFIASGIALDAEYYRSQEQLLEAFSRQWQQIEDILAKTP